MIKLLLLSANPEAVSACRNTFDHLAVRCECAGSVEDMHRLLTSTPFSGLVLDVLTTARASQKDRMFIQEVSEVYPALLLRWNSAAKRVRGMVFGEILDKQDPLGDFVTRFCRAERGHTYREDKRHAIHLNLLLSCDQGFSPDQVERTVTLDLSPGGCFIVSSRNWQGFDIAWIRLRELSDPTPIQVQICRYLPWGEQCRIPGIGVKFLDLQPSQCQEISRLCAGRQH